MTNNNIKLGDFVIIQRQKYTKLFKFNSLTAQTALGKDQVQLKNINEHPYSTTFKMNPIQMHGKRVIELEPCSDVSSIKESVNVTECGTDNRNLNMDTETQTLKADDILKLRQSGSSAGEIVNIIVENSKTFTSKTEYSQDKYLRKKEKKYFEFLQIRRPTLRLIAEIMYRLDPEKILGLRMDSLSQLISYANVSAMGNFLLYESGTNGLVPAALINSIGANTEGKLLHLHQGNVPQKQALQALNLEQEQLNRCISANIYSILRQFYQKSGGLKRTLDEVVNDSAEPPAKVAKTDETENLREITDTDMEIATEPSEHDDSAKNGDKEAKTPKWFYENERGCELLRENLDALIIVAKEHPIAIVNALLPFVKSSRPVVIFSLSRDLLVETFISLKSSSQVTGLKLTSNWLRNYQILPNRTHPDVNMNGHSGFILHGHTVR
ncbi:tRNA (adenine(58)-N(1))-methyltransferase non-catalytic subunit TRM6 [Contarinia nasturtii]|uniref:tRNA (adenine(58)-N(1))-methyltransferase non-catalytic subunit TRM6 n=1 Tax=Contarinia nasturtii TaxID=265458 RepID=UPI0012D49A6E|nr:tRNA (adenine(58)-N(1))-methyltransferase non-catalytic subunit TRM6 [Contarinia nasturtii]